MIKVSVPGSLFLSGEWAILDPGNPGVITALDKRIFAEVKSSPDRNIHITLKDFKMNDLKARFNQNKLQFEKKFTERERKNILFARWAIETALKYLKTWKPFQIKLWSSNLNIEDTKKDGIKKKPGFGFSAASIVAIISSLLKFHNLKIKKNEIKDKIFKLSALSHYLAQGKIGSGFDIAASTYGGIFIYKRFNPDWLEKERRSNKKIGEIIQSKWLGFFIQKLKLPKNLNFIVGWTKKSSSTSQMVKKFNQWKSKNQKEYKRLYYQISSLVRELIKAWKFGEKERILKFLRENEDYLRELGEVSRVNIETKELKRLSEIANWNGAAGKLSGAGGGDCGIALAFDKKIIKKVKKEWKDNNILPIDVKIDFSGIKY